MRKLMILVSALLIAAAFGLANTASAADTMTMKGYIIDTKCATTNADKLAEFVKTHPKDCALACHETGYNLYSDGKLYKMDKESSDMAYEFLQKPDSKTMVSVEVVMTGGDTVKLVKVMNAE
jgi:hypothetical protein